MLIARVRPRRGRGRRWSPGLLTVAALAFALLGRETAVAAGRAGWDEDSTSAVAIEAKERGGSSNKRQRGEPQSSSLAPKRPPSTFEHLVAGTVGGVSGALVSYPLDTVRIRMQTHGEKMMGPARTASALFKEAGIAGFYRGVLSPMVGTGFVKAAAFGGYGLCQSLVRRATGKDNDDLTLIHLGVAAMGSGLIASFVVTPVERIKVVMQAALSSSPPPLTTGVPRLAGGYENAWGCARDLVSEQGLAGLYAGLGPTLLREVPGYAFCFATYEACKRVLLRDEGRGSSTRGSAVMFKTALSGAFAGVAAWLPVYPADVVKSRMQSAGASGGGMFVTASSIWKTEGLAPFFRGLSPTIARAMVNHAAAFLVYEAAMSLFRKDRRVPRNTSEGGVTEGREE